VKAFTDAVGLRALGLGARVIDVLDRRDRAHTRAVPGCGRTRCRGQSVRAGA
jgi:hypothetical protein